MNEEEFNKWTKFIENIENTHESNLESIHSWKANQMDKVPKEYYEKKNLMNYISKHVL